MSSACHSPRPTHPDPADDEFAQFLSAALSGCGAVVGGGARGTYRRAMSHEPLPYSPSPGPGPGNPSSSGYPDQRRTHHRHSHHGHRHHRDYDQDEEPHEDHAAAAAAHTGRYSAPPDHHHRRRRLPHSSPASPTFPRRSHRPPPAQYHGYQRSEDDEEEEEDDEEAVGGYVVGESSRAAAARDVMKRMLFKKSRAPPRAGAVGEDGGGSGPLQDHGMASPVQIHIQQAEQQPQAHAQSPQDYDEYDDNYGNVSYARRHQVAYGACPKWAPLANARQMSPLPPGDTYVPPRSPSHHTVLQAPPCGGEGQDGVEWDVGDMRPRGSSVPARHVLFAPPDKSRPENDVHKVRKFIITSKGVVDEGSRFVSNSRRNSTCSMDKQTAAAASAATAATLSGAAGSLTANARTQQEADAPSATKSSRPASHFKVLLIGSAGVGKRAMIREFVDPTATASPFLSIDDEQDKSVSILLDGEESTLEFVDMSDKEVGGCLAAHHIDAFVVVYSVEDRRSFEAAIDRLYEIREEEGRFVALILVANKTDLVRSRLVPEDEGRAAAKTYDSKYIEVSAAIDHKIDELLVGILKQIRLIKKKQAKAAKSSRRSKLGADVLDACCLLRARENVLARIFKGESLRTKSCDNLYVL